MIDLKPGVVTSTMLRWGAVLALVLMLAIVAPAIALSGRPSEVEADRDVAAQAEAVEKDAARVEEIVEAARAANPNLTQPQLSRVRAAAMYLVEMRRRPNPTE